MPSVLPIVIVPVYALLAILVAAIIYRLSIIPASLRRASTSSSEHYEPLCQHKTFDMSKPRTPIYFLSHGGPNIMYQKDHPVYEQLQAIGREITQVVKPKAIVVFSAHWQGTPNTIEVNNFDGESALIYDFYNFPDHYYKEKYPNRGSKEVAERVLELLGENGIKSEGMRRGLDHGVWASFKVAFDPETNPLNVPIVQVSLFDSDSASQHHALGAAVAQLRSEGIQIIVSGMAVHNLRDIRRGIGFVAPLPYVEPFDEALKEAVESEPSIREEKMAQLLKRSDARKAHPEFEHLLPIHIGAGAALEDRGTRLWTLCEGSLSWAQYRFGEAVAA